MKIFYTYANSRTKEINEVFKKDSADTRLYGFNHFESLGDNCTYIEPEKIIPKSLRMLSTYHVRQWFLFFKAKEFDIVFGSPVISMAFLRKIFKSRAKFVLFNLSLTRLLVTNKSFIRRKIVHILLSELDAVVCPSLVQKEYILENTSFPPDKVFFIPLGVDNDFHKYSPPNKRNGTILSVGRDNGRDYHTVIEVAKQMQDKNFEIVCSKRNVENITTWPKNVKVHFDLSYEELREKYRTSNILLMTTHDDKYEDGADCSGQTVLLDAMASGLPIVATKKRSLDDYITDQEDALIVPSYDVSACIKAIENLSSLDLRLSLTQSARKKVDQYFNTYAMSKKLKQVFEAVI